MNERETLDIMASDMKLWEAAQSKPLGPHSVEKTLELPWGIGTVVVNMEGMTDATKKREAVGAFANYIRGVIKEARDDDAVTARAKAAVARREPLDGEDSNSLSADQGLRHQTVQASAHEGAGETYERHVEEPAGLGETLTARRVALSERIGRVETDLARWRKELKGIDAALAAMEDD